MPLRVVPSSTGLPSKRCPGIGFFSRAYQKIGVFQHVVPPTRLRLEFPRETGLILRCAGKVGNPLQTKQGNRPTGRSFKEVGSGWFETFSHIYVCFLRSFVLALYLHEDSLRSES